MSADIIQIELYWEDLELGTKWATRARTITEPDLVSFINTAWLTESLFTDHDHPIGPAVRGRLVPGSMVYAIAEGLTLSAVGIYAFALLHTDMEVKGPTYLADTIHVCSSIVELKTTSKSDRAIGRFHNEVINQKGDIVLAYSALRMIRRRSWSEDK